MLLDVRRITAAAVSIFAVGILSVTAIGANSQALTTYSTRTSFLAAAGAVLPVTDFSADSGNAYQTLSIANDAGIPLGVVFSSTGGTPEDIFVAPPLFAGDSAISVPSAFANFFGTPLIATLSPSVTAVGADLISYPSSAPLTVTVDLVGGSTATYTVTPSSTASQFFGVIGTGGDVIDGISFGPPSGFTAGVADFAFGNAVATGTPEPGSLALLCCLGVSGAFYRFRKQRVKTS